MPLTTQQRTALDAWIATAPSAKPVDAYRGNKITAQGLADLVRDIAAKDDAAHRRLKALRPAEYSHLLPQLTTALAGNGQPARQQVAAILLGRMGVAAAEAIDELIVLADDNGADKSARYRAAQALIQIARSDDAGQ